MATTLVRRSWLPLRTGHPLYQHILRYQSKQFIIRHNFPTRLFRRNYSKPSANPPPNPTPNLGSPEPHSFTARLKKLSREYGWTVIGVYLALTVADLPFCFLAVKYIGAERIAHAEHVVVGGAKDLIGRIFPNMFDQNTEKEAEAEVAQAEQEELAGEPSK